MARKSSAAIELVKPATQAVDRFSTGLANYLSGLGLPVEGVLVVPHERMTVLTNAPELVALISSASRVDAMYVSKFIAACSAGLFDAALNFIWDEVVVRLRTRVSRFDLAYFYDTAVPAGERQNFESEEDLRSLSDASLIKGALKCGMLTEVGYRHLDYIREMRNWASAAHPNQAELTGLQLVAWFQTCLREVIVREPEGEVLVVGRLLRNLREQVIDARDVPSIEASVGNLPEPLAVALLRSVVGLYCDPRQDVRVRDNIKLIARRVWNVGSDASRGEVGLKHANFAANGDIDRKKLVHEFLDLVDGLAYLPATDLALEIQTLVTQLESAHDGWDNFHNEPPVAKQLRKYVPETGQIPAQVNDDYVRVLTRCRVGRTSGISRSAVAIYDQLIDLFDAPQLKAFVRTLAAPELALLLDNIGCADRYRGIITRLQSKAVGSSLQRALASMAAAPALQLPVLWKDAAFQRIVAAA